MRESLGRMCNKLGDKHLLRDRIGEYYVKITVSNEIMLQLVEGP